MIDVNIDIQMSVLTFVRSETKSVKSGYALTGPGCQAADQALEPGSDADGWSVEARDDVAQEFLWTGSGPPKIRVAALQLLGLGGECVSGKKVCEFSCYLGRGILFCLY